MLLVGFLYSALLAVSLFNTVLLLWLGLTVVLNTERRRGGVWLMGGGLAAGGGVFLAHSGVLIEGATRISTELNVWWPLGWGGLIFTPLAWYAAMLWYNGYWDARESALHRRHRYLFWTSAAFGGVLALLFVAARPLPFTIRFGGLGVDISAAPALFGLPLLVLLYPLFILACISFSLDAVVRPGPTARAMGSIARARARPWLIATSLTFLAVSLLVVGLVMWLVAGGRDVLRIVADPVAIGLMWVDLAVSSLVATAVLLLGQAIVSYEIFTGRVLPRRGLRRQWHSAIALAAGSSTVVTVIFLLDFPPTYVFLFATLLIAVTYTLFNWRAYAEREKYIAHLRPFVSSEHVYDSLLAAEEEQAGHALMEHFRALCRDVLATQRAYLLPLGALSALVPSRLAFPEEAEPPTMSAEEVVAQARSSQAVSFPIDPETHGGALWAVPLWGARGLIGVLLLGEKADGGLYSEEEIEIARASGERLLDSLAGALLAQRLTALQRRRFVENQVLDQQARRVLHDEILPSLHAAMLALRNGAAEEQTAETMRQLAGVHHQVSELLREIPVGGSSQVAELGLVAALRKLVESEFAHEFDAIAWDIEPEAERRSGDIPSLAGEVVYYAAREVVRNAARHGRGGETKRPLDLSITVVWRNGLEVRIADDGVGPQERAEPDAGAGRGLTLHGTMLAVIGGSLIAEPGPEGGTTVTLSLPEAPLEQA